MTIYQKLQDALEELQIPIKEDFFGGGATEYITWTETGESFTFMGNDEPINDVVGLYIHWFLPRNKKYSETATRIRRMLLAGDFTWPKMQSVEEPDKTTRHIVFECQVERDLD